MSYNYLNIICCNIRSINAHKLLLFIENDAKYKHIDLLVLTETRHNVLSCNYVIDDYSMYYFIKKNQNDDVMVIAKH